MEKGEEEKKEELDGPDAVEPGGILYEEDQTYKVRLTNFDGPMELLLHLIRKHKYDIYDIPIAAILKQYLEAIEEMKDLDFDLAGEFLVMAATLAQIKSRMLLPRPQPEGEDGSEGQDPRAELVRRLLVYERFREAAEELSERPLLGREIFARAPRTEPPEGFERPDAPIEANLLHLLLAFREVLKEASEEFVHEVSRQRMTTTEAIAELLERFESLKPGEALPFRDLFPGRPQKQRVIALFMGLLELVKMRAIRIRQDAAFGDIRISPTAGEADTGPEQDLFREG